MLNILKNFKARDFETTSDLKPLLSLRLYGVNLCALKLAAVVNVD